MGNRRGLGMAWKSGSGQGADSSQVPQEEIASRAARSGVGIRSCGAGLSTSAAPNGEARSRLSGEICAKTLR
jgi:hypothetical protein